MYINILVRGGATGCGALSFRERGQGRFFFFCFRFEGELLLTEETEISGHV